MALIAILLLVVCSSCASILNGPDQKVTIVSNPPGANIQINGQEAGITPATFRIIRAKNHVITLSKDGYHHDISDLKRTLSGVALFYLLPGGLLSAAIDATQGAAFSFPDKIERKLEPLFHPQTIIAAHLAVLKSVL